MMRRLFWMIAGALLGVSGYRRVSRLARALTAGGRRGDRARGNRMSSVALFARDVRDGMDLYADRHPRRTGRTLVDQPTRARRPGLVHVGEERADGA